MANTPAPATTQDTAADDTLNLSPRAVKVLKRTSTAATLPSVIWPALGVAGGVTLATVTTAGIGGVALGIGAAAVGAERTISRVKRLKNFRQVFDIMAGNSDATAENPKNPLFYRNPLLHLASGALLLGGGIALAAATGGFVATALAATMILSGGVSSFTGSVRTLTAGLGKIFSRKKKAAPDAAAPQTMPEPEAPASTLGTRRAQTAFTAAATPSEPAAAPAAKPAFKPAAPKGPALG